MRHHEGEGDPAFRRAIEGHLAECAECRRAYARLGAGGAGGDPDPEILEVMLRAASEWERTHDSAVVRRAVADGVRPYVGNRAADALAAAGTADGSALLTEIEPVLALFLGREAATHLMGRILDRAFVRR